MMHANGDDNLATLNLGVDDFMTMDSAPGGYITLHAGVSAAHRQQVTGGQGFYFVLCSYYRHWAQESAGIKFVFRHARIRGLPRL